MTKPGVEESVQVLAGESAAELGGHDLHGPAGLAIGEQLADAQDGPQARRDRPSQLLADQLVRFLSVAAALGVAEDDPRGQAVEHRGRDLARVRAGQLVVDVLGPDGDVLARERVAYRGQADEGRADDPHHARLLGPGGDCRGQLSSVRGGGVHLPVGGNDQRSHDPE